MYAQSSSRAPDSTSRGVCAPTPSLACERALTRACPCRPAKMLSHLNLAIPLSRGFPGFHSSTPSSIKILAGRAAPRGHGSSDLSHHLLLASATIPPAGIMKCFARTGVRNTQRRHLSTPSLAPRISSRAWAAGRNHWLDHARSELYWTRELCSGWNNNSGAFAFLIQCTYIAPWRRACVYHSCWKAPGTVELSCIFPPVVSTSGITRLAVSVS